MQQSYHSAATLSGGNYVHDLVLVDINPVLLGVDVKKTETSILFLNMLTSNDVTTNHFFTAMGQGGCTPLRGQGAEPLADAPIFVVIMAGNTVKEMTTNFGKLDKFEGHDFRRWQKKMHFLLTTLKVVYVLTTPMPELLEDATVEAIRIRAKWENDDYICRGHILNGMSDSLFDVYTNVESAKELWDSLESKYMAEDSSSKKFLVSNFNNYKMVDSRPVMEQYNELLRILGQYTQHGLKMDESISVSRFGYYNNGMFMLNLNKVSDDSDSVYMSSSTVVNSSLWHARLGHVHYKRMLEMSKDELILAIDEKILITVTLDLCDFHATASLGIIHETTAPYTPQQNGVAERKNRALKEMVNSMLSYSGLSEGFWGEAMLTACYLLNRVPNKRNKTTPYELCIEEDPRTYNEAMQSRDSAFWKEEIDDEIGSIMENNTWVLSDLPPGCKPLGFRQKEGIDYFDTYAPVARITTIRLLLALAAIHNLVIHQMDVKTAFLNGDLDEEM
ncbi:zinc finger, CCHC-type containing protein [Tanacetum coccineum]